MQLAPIILFAYNRPWHVKQTLESLAANSLAQESELHIFCDGAKDGANEQTLKNIEQVRAIAKERSWCKETFVHEAPKNKGLARSVIDGVTSIVNKYGKVIVIEDDVLLSPYFLKFMNDSLDLYKDDNKVLSIGSWNYFCNPEKLNGNFFLRYPDSIAWATFSRAWNLFEHNSAELLEKLKTTNKLNRFNADSANQYFEKMLEEQLNGRVDSWAIRWTATAVVNDMLSFYPQYSLSKHIGFGQGATHETGDNDYNRDLKVYQKAIPAKPIPAIEDNVAFKEWVLFIESLRPKETVRQKIKKVLPSFFVDIYRKLK